MTRSGDPWTKSGMTVNNKRHEAPVRAFLQDIVRQPQAHACWMNMLSMLEHMGSRKIMVSQMNRTLTEDALKHLAEEARHAYFFKRQAERVAGKALDGYTEDNTMARVPALMYFGRLDAGITKRVLSKASSPRHATACLDRGDPYVEAQSASSFVDPVRASASDEARQRDDGKGCADPDNQAYPWVSLIIELRACWLYHIYHQVLEEAKVHISLKSLLAEEDLHLAEMFEMVGENTDLLRELSAYETELFGKLWNVLSEKPDLHRKAA